MLKRTKLLGILNPVELESAKDVFNYIKNQNLIGQPFKIKEFSGQGMKIVYYFQNHLLVLPSNTFESGQDLLKKSIDDFFWKLDYNKAEDTFLLSPTTLYDKEDIRDSARDPETGIVDKIKFQ